MRIKIKIPKLRQKFIEQFQFTTDAGASLFCENVVIGSFGKPYKLKKKTISIRSNQWEFWHEC